MSNLFSSSLIPKTMVIVCPILTIPDTSEDQGPLPDWICIQHCKLSPRKLAVTAFNIFTWNTIKSSQIKSNGPTSQGLSVHQQRFLKPLQNLQSPEFHQISRISSDIQKEPFIENDQMAQVRANGHIPIEPYKFPNGIPSYQNSNHPKFLQSLQQALDLTFTIEHNWQFKKLLYRLTNHSLPVLKRWY